MPSRRFFPELQLLFFANMESHALIAESFPSGALSKRQTEQFAALGTLYEEWNTRINVISRKDIDKLYTRHVLHSLSLAALWGPLQQGTSLIDIGTGGGFPGIPLAIFYPECRFHLIDRIGKKIRVAQEIAAAVGLENVSFQHGDIGECRSCFNFVVSRAVMPLNKLVKLTEKNVEKASKTYGINRYHNGLFCLKGGNITAESEGIRFPIIEFDIRDSFIDEFFDTKKIVYVPMSH